MTGQPTKQEIRESVWRLLQEAGAARFPGARGRIPNFKGSEQCALQVADLDAWMKARTVKANPDSPQRAMRHLALRQRKVVYMAAPRLAESKPFIELDPKRLEGRFHEASSIRGAFKLGRPVSLSEMRRIDLVLCGSVAVRRDGARVGKGGGYSDLEYAIALESGRLTPETPILTTVHPLQIVETGLPILPHDIAVDFIVTPDETITCETTIPRPQGIYWEFLQDEKIESIPVLKRKLRSRAKP